MGRPGVVTGSTSSPLGPGSACVAKGLRRRRVRRSESTTSRDLPKLRRVSGHDKFSRRLEHMRVPMHPGKEDVRVTSAFHSCQILESRKDARFLHLICENGTHAGAARGSWVRPGRRLVTLTRLDAQVEDILAGRERAGGEVGEGARRVIGAVEIDDDSPFGRGRGKKEPA